MKNIYIYPSLLSADFNILHQEISDVILNNADGIHFDVMDGVFVNNISFGIPVLKSLKDKHQNVLFDVHLMIVNPIKYFNKFLESGADILTIHFETCSKLEIIEMSESAHKQNKKIGLSIKPNTSVDEILDLLPYLDLVLVMSVEPGFGGQAFINTSLDKIKYLDELRNKYNYKYLIEVDGGINDITAKQCKDCGCDVLVAGSYIFKQKDRKKAILSLK